MLAFLRKHKTALILSLLYFVPAIIWVFFSDGWLYAKSESLEVKRLMEIDKIKDASFVLGISILFFFTISLSRRRLINTRHQYQNLFDQNPNPMWIYETGTLRFVAVNNAAIRNYGYDRSEFLSMTLADIRPAEDIPLLTKYLADPVSSRKRQVWRHIKKSGERITVEVRSDDVTFFGTACRLVSITDITEKIKNDIDLNRLSLVARNATNSIIITSADAKIEWVNDAFTRLTGYTLEEVVGLRPSEFLHGPQTDQQVRDEIFACMQQKKPFSGEILNYRKDGSIFWLRLTVSPVLMENEITNFVTVQTDITAIKEQNNRLRDIAYTVSHGFRKPVANILGLLEFVNETGTEKQVIQHLKSSAEELDQELRVIVEKTSMIGQKD